MKKTTKNKLKNTLIITMMCAALSTIFLTSQKPMIKASAEEQYSESITPTINDIKDQYTKKDQYTNKKYETNINSPILYGVQTTYTSAIYNQDEQKTYSYMLAVTELHYQTTINTLTAQPTIKYLRAVHPTYDNANATIYSTRNNPNLIFLNTNLSNKELMEDLIQSLDLYDIGRKKEYEISVTDIMEETLPQFNVQLTNDKTIYYYTYLSAEHDGYTPLFEINVINTMNGYFINTPTNIEVIDIPNIMFNILTMPFAFISTAFNLTMFEGTPYAINFSSIFFGLLGIGILLLILRIYMKGGSI